MKVIELCERRRGWVNRIVEEQWGGPLVVTRGNVMDASVLPGFVAECEGEPGAFVLYRMAGGDCEIVALYSAVENRGYAGALVDRVLNLARQARCRRVWLVTTNDNTHAIRYYQKRGFFLRAVHIGAIEQSRSFKEIPALGIDGIPILHEVEFDWML